jgi:hypothetical protein
VIDVIDVIDLGDLVDLVDLADEGRLIGLLGLLGLLGLVAAASEMPSDGGANMVAWLVTADSARWRAASADCVGGCTRWRPERKVAPRIIGRRELFALEPVNP